MRLLSSRVSFETSCDYFCIIEIVHKQNSSHSQFTDNTQKWNERKSLRFFHWVNGCCRRSSKTWIPFKPMIIKCQIKSNQMLSRFMSVRVYWENFVNFFVRIITLMLSQITEKIIVDWFQLYYRSRPNITNFIWQNLMKFRICDSWYRHNSQQIS